jgi:dTDP-4-dehydrorhamnose 3,5-epimerase
VTFKELSVPGVWLVEPDIFPDERGSFARAWVPEEFAARGLDTAIVQCGLASNRRRGTIRGLHYQTAPFEEVKFVRATRGAVFDVAVDLRPESPTYCQWVGVKLTADNRLSLYLPRGVAHGYQTLADETDVLYFVSSAYSPAHQAGVRWDDPAFGVAWPLGPPTAISDRDRALPGFAPVAGRRG